MVAAHSDIRHFLNLIERKLDVGIPEIDTKSKIDPALLTFNEYRDIVDKERKYHSDSSYQTNLENLNKYEYSSKYPRLIRNIRVNGLDFKIKGKPEELSYVKHDANGEILRVDGDVVYYTDEELKKLGLKSVDWQLAIFNDQDQRVATVQDEWGCVLVMVADEYKGFGFGPMLVKIIRTLYPDKVSGGFTPGGFKNFQKVYREFVRDALKSGLYSKLVKQGDMTIERVKEIVASAKIDFKPDTKQSVDLSSSDPSDYLLYVGEAGDFILYDRKLAELLNSNKFVHFTENMIKGIVYVSLHDTHTKWAFTRKFGGDTPEIRRLMLACAIEFSRREGFPLYIEPDEAADVPTRYGTVGPINKQRGFDAQLVTPTDKDFDYDAMGKVEKAFRKKFDRFDEFFHQMTEMAYAKYHPTGS